MDATPATAPTNTAIDALLVKITETELAIQDLQAAIDGDGNGAGQLSAPQHKQASKHLLNRQRKIIFQRQQLDKLPSVLRSGKCGLRVWTKAMTSLLLMPWTATAFFLTPAVALFGAVRRHLAPFPCIWLVLLRVASTGSRSRPMAIVKVGRW
jgi:hypothetical protein